MKKAEDKLREHTGDPEGCFEHMHRFPDLKVTYTVPFHYRKKKGNGEFTKKKFTMPVKIIYNPFTGEKLES